jgi:hypothetical protein
MMQPVSNSTSFEQILEYYHSLTDDTTKEVIERLTDRFSNNSTLNAVVNITDRATLLTWLVIDAVECYGRQSDFGCDISRDYLYFVYEECDKQQINTLLKLCAPYSHKDYYRHGKKALVPALSYEDIGQLFRDFYDKKPIDTAAWRLIYFTTNAIHHKNQREDSSWFEAAKSFFITSVFEDFLSKHIPGLALHDRGVRHDMYCPVSGTGDPDFYYTTETGKFTAEFKRALKTVPALAQHAFNNPSYIYNANYLLTYGIVNYYPAERNAFYFVNYTDRPYSFTRLDIDDTWLEPYINIYGEWLQHAVNEM